ALGNLIQVRHDALGFLSRGARDYGDVVRVRLPGQTGYLLTRPELVEEVLVSQSGAFVKPSGREPTGTTEAMFGPELLDEDGDFWLRHRRLTQPAFSKDELARHAELVVSSTERMLHSWRDGEERDIHHDMAHLTLGVVARAMLGTDVSERGELL